MMQRWALGLLITLATLTAEPHGIMAQTGNFQLLMRWPPQVQVGSTFDASVTILGQEGTEILDLLVTSACRTSGSVGRCTATEDQDPGVFTILSATGGGSCAGVGQFDVQPRSTPGEVDLDPFGRPFFIGTFFNPCVVNLRIQVNKLPIHPAPLPAPPNTTFALSQALMRGSPAFFVAGSTQVTVTTTPPLSLPSLPASPAPPINQIPTLSEWVMILLAVFIVLVGALTVRKRRTT